MQLIHVQQPIIKLLYTVYFWQSLLSGGQSSQYASGQSTRQAGASHNSVNNANSQYIEETKQQQQVCVMLAYTSYLCSSILVSAYEHCNVIST